MKTWEEIREAARLKLEEAKTLLEGDAPDMEAVKALQDEADKLKAEAETVKAVSLGLAEFDAPATKTVGVSVTVTGDEADRALEGNPFKSLGEFLQSVARGGDKRLLPLKSNNAADEGGYDMVKAVGARAIGNLKATGLSEGVPSAGGFLVGTDTAPGLLARTYEVGSLLQRVDMVGISAGSNAMTFNAEDETSRADGSRRGGIRAYWAAEASEKTASQPKFRQMELKLNKVIGLCYATDELLADANALGSWIMSAFPEELSFVVEDAIINGTGAGMPLGILNSGALVSVSKESGQAADTIVAENIIKMYARMWARSRANAVWLINQDIEPQLFQLNLPVGTGGQLLYVPPGGLSASPYASILGRPVLPVEYCGTVGDVGDIIFADLGQYQMINKGGIDAASSIHVRFVYDETCYRFVYRVDGQPKWSKPLTPFKGSNTLSPFVALATRS
ncbi:MAG: phage major capsid protein [Chloroflexi bacterium]|nr:MAG: phage major capsid protein [Chloroflexota bacterium]